MSTSTCIVAYYFSASWCGPCRQFTPLLKKMYAALRNAGIDTRAFEVCFVSSDRNEQQFDEYFETMPWQAIDYRKEEVRRKLGLEYNIRSIPTLVVVREHDGGKDVVVSRDARSEVIAFDASNEDWLDLYTQWMER